MKTILAIVVVSFAIAEVVFGSPVSVCSSPGGNIDVSSFQLKGADCDNKVCRIYSGEKVIFSINFTSSKYSYFSETRLSQAFFAERPSKVLKIDAKIYVSFHYLVIFLKKSFWSTWVSLIENCVSITSK